MRSLQRHDGRRPHTRPFAFGVALCGMYLAANAAHAKAETQWYYVDNLEMVITHVDVGWPDGDTDLNLVMRPLLPAKESFRDTKMALLLWAARLGVK